MNESSKNRFFKLLTVGIVWTLLFLNTSSAVADDKAEAQTIVEKSRLTFNSFMNNKGSEQLRTGLKKSAK